MRGLVRIMLCIRAGPYGIIGSDYFLAVKEKPVKYCLMLLFHSLILFSVECGWSE